MGLSLPLSEILKSTLVSSFLNSPKIEMRLKQNSFKTVSKLFCFGFISICAQFLREN